MSLPLLIGLSIAGLAYIYAGYPIAVWLLARRRPESKLPSNAWQGSISVVLVACNEAHRLTAKLENLLASSAAGQITEILVGSDGSTDATVSVVQAFPDLRVRAIPFSERRGKPAVLNDLVAQCRGDVVLFVDARQLLAPNAIARMIRRFADPEIGVVSGELVFRQDATQSTAAEGVGLYWTYEKWIRNSESRFRSVPGATGALYAIRRPLFRPIAPQTLLDDVVIPMQAVEQGYHCVLERGAEAYDTPSASADREGIRKRRTIAGCAQLIVRQPRWLLPWRNPICWEFCSHKLARLVSPLLLATALIGNLLLMDRPEYQVLLSMQLAFYVSAIVGLLYQQSGHKSKLFGPSLMFCALNAVTVAALWDAARGRYNATWQKAV
jgi:cellulose synthase/poly-beta-1,6-N-acetylglucosamine synthase-like glycosyltransferase